MTFSKFSSLSLVSPPVCVSFSTLPLLPFPLTLPLMVIYLVGKGFTFSPERSTTGGSTKKKKAKQLQKHEKRVEKDGKYIIGVGLPGDTDPSSEL